MKKILIISIIMTFLFGTAFLLIQTDNENEAAAVTEAEWSMNATAIEACTCPMFCQCYFNTEPAAHSHGHGQMDGEEGETEHYCKFNMAWKVNEGHYGDTDLDGALFWIAGDLGEGWEDGNVDWANLHFDPAVTDEKREGIAAILPSLFPANWSSFGVEEDKTIQWEANSKESVALLDGGNSAEMHLIHPPTAVTDEPVILSNVQYWGAPRNDGFVLMPNEIQAYREGDKAFESRGTNGFMITVDLNSDDF